MLDDALILELRQRGVDHTTHLKVWDEAKELLAAVDALVRAGGSNAIVKVDGGRTEQDAYTIVISGGRLGDASFRKDGIDLRLLLREALSFYLMREDGASARP